MRTIDMETWPRRAHFEHFNSYDHPVFGVSANVDITRFYRVIKQRGISFTIATVYLITRAANAIPEFRYRIRGKEVVEHQVVHPSFTILVAEDIFSFCSVEYDEEFSTFREIAAQGIERVKAQVELEDEPGRDDWLFMTALPWVSFTAVKHPRPSHPGGSVPIFAWGKFFQAGESLMMPLNVEVHHALVDGVHMGKYYLEVERILKEPEAVLG